jgi:hypothetical protein
MPSPTCAAWRSFAAATPTGPRRRCARGATAALAAFYRPCPFPAAPAQPALRRHQSDRPDCAAQMDALPAPDGQNFNHGRPDLPT